MRTPIKSNRKTFGPDIEPLYIFPVTDLNLIRGFGAINETGSGSRVPRHRLAKLDVQHVDNAVDRHLRPRSSPFATLVGLAMMNAWHPEALGLETNQKVTGLLCSPAELGRASVGQRYRRCALAIAA
jgi:hypothetical protein